jgi:predicted Rdx family selenoprotein
VKAWIEGRSRGPVQVEAGKAGQFDVVVDGRLVYSRYDTGTFPDEPKLQELFK